MAVQTPKTYSQYQTDILSSLMQTGIRQLAAGGKARAIGDIMADQLATHEATVFQNLSQTLLPYATDTSLDLIGEIYGLYRLPQQTAQIDQTDQNFKFYVRSGTFGDINSGRDITIPAGVSLYTAIEGGPVYAITSPVTLSATANSAFFSATSTASGSLGNAPAGYVNQHNFTGYAQHQFGALLVTNNFGIVEGRDAEDDESFRFRIHLALQSRSGANQAAIEGAILQIPGVQNVSFSPYAGGFLAYVYGISPNVGASLLSNVQSAINGIVAYPNTGLAVAPDLVGISLATTVTFSGSQTAQDQSSILSQAASAVETYINNLAIGNPLVINEITAQVLGVAGILDIGQPNAPINEIFIWRSRNDGTRYSRYLVNDYQPALGERIVVENIANAINLTAAKS